MKNNFRNRLIFMKNKSPSTNKENKSYIIVHLQNKYLFSQIA